MILFKQTLQILSGKTNISTPTVITTKGWDLPSETTTITDINESGFNLYLAAASVVSMSFSMGTIALGKIFAIRPNADIDVAIQNTLGSNTYRFKANTTSVLHIEFTAITVTNPSNVDIDGYYFVAGD